MRLFGWFFNGFLGGILDEPNHVRLHILRGSRAGLVEHHADYLTHGLAQVVSGILHIGDRLPEKRLCLGVGFLIERQARTQLALAAEQFAQAINGRAQACCCILRRAGCCLSRGSCGLLCSGLLILASCKGWDDVLRPLRHRNLRRHRLFGGLRLLFSLRCRRLILRDFLTQHLVEHGIETVGRLLLFCNWFLCGFFALTRCLRFALILGRHHWLFRVGALRPLLEFLHRHSLHSAAALRA